MQKILPLQVNRQQLSLFADHARKDNVREHTQA